MFRIEAQAEGLRGWRSLKGRVSGGHEEEEGRGGAGAPASERHGAVSPVYPMRHEGCQGLLLLCLQLVYSSPGNGDKAGMRQGRGAGGAQDQEPNSGLFTVINEPGARAPRSSAKNTCFPLRFGSCHPATATHRHLS